MTKKFYRWLCGLVKSSDIHPFYISAPWRKARAKALAEHHYECLTCKALGKLTRATMVHHVLPVKSYPQYALSLYVDGKVQLMPLCHDCHAAIESKHGVAEKYPEKW